MNELETGRAILDGTAQGEAREAAERFRAAVFPRTVDAVVARAARRRRRWVWLGGGGAALVAVAAAALLLLVVRPPDLAVKGGSVRVYARRGEHTFVPGDDRPLRAGDRLRFEVTSAAPRRVLVASVDGRGAVSIFYPSTAVPAGATVLDGSIVLDDAPGPERVWLFFSDGDLDEAAVRAALAAGDAGSIGAERLSIVLRKEP